MARTINTAPETIIETFATSRMNCLIKVVYHKSMDSGTTLCI